MACEPLKVNAARSFETLAISKSATERTNPEEPNPQQQLVQILSFLYRASIQHME